MARPKATPEQRAEIRRGIQTAAAAIYRAKGISGISARAVAKEAGVSVGAIYAHFGDLTGLMQSLWTGRVERQNQNFIAVAQSHDAPINRIGALLSEYVTFAAENADLYRHAFMFVRPEALEKPAPQPPVSITFGELLLRAVEDGQAANEIAPGDPQLFMQVLWSGLHGAIALPINFDRLDFTPTGEIADAVVDMLLKAVRA